MRPVVQRIFLVIVLTILAIQPASPWWDNGHVLINRTAALKVPASMPSFMRLAAERLAYLGPEPDRWRERSEFSLKNSQEPDHYLNMEMVADVPDLPQGRYDYYRLLYAKRVAAKKNGDEFLPETVGTQPYITIEIYDRLKVAFREYRRMKQQNLPTEAVEQNAVLYAGWLGHYVADGSNPLHTTISYDGWVGPNPNGYTTQKGIHAEFEGRFVTRTLDQMEIASLVQEPVRQKDPWHDYLQYLRDSNHLVEKVYQLEKAGEWKDTGTPESRQFLRQRLAAGAQMLLNLWYTAWEESALPVPPRSPTPASGK
ncbi:MAG TPA: nuclease [Terriglobales bacterium]|nr:nuclease [Terriglobales bacterium]